jgi:hypothetical protein
MVGTPRQLSTSPTTDDGGVHVWSRAMANGDVAVAFINMDGNVAHPGTLIVSDVTCVGCSHAGTDPPFSNKSHRLKIPSGLMLV